MASPELLATALRLLEARTWHLAEDAARAAMADDPADPHAMVLAGLAVAAMGEAERAAPLLNRAAAARPEADHPCLDLGRLKPPRSRPLVIRQFRACLNLSPGDDRLRLAFAEFLLDHDQPAGAEELLAGGPDTAARYHLAGLAQAEQSRFPAAIASFQRAVALNPRAAASWSNLGMVLKVEDRFPEAFLAHDQAVALAPDNPQYRVNRAVALLKAGEWERAWHDYEARLQLPSAPVIGPSRLMPSLRPGDSLVGTTILARHEDGFGDTLQFLRYLPLLAERGARVVAYAPSVLARIMRAVPGVAEVRTSARNLPRHDFVCPIFSLPRVFASSVQTVPPVPGLRFDSALTRQWAARLPIERRLRVGLVWAGQARPTLQGFTALDRRRSAGLAVFAPLADVPGLDFISLQSGRPGRQTPPPGMTLLDLMPDVSDFADTAAIIANLDVVVSVDTSVVHLAGLVGKPVFLLDRYDGCWRWLSGRSDSPWYPHLTIFRQQQPGEWSEVMSRVAASLQAMVLFRGLGTPPRTLRESAVVA